MHGVWLGAALIWRGQPYTLTGKEENQGIRRYNDKVLQAFIRMWGEGQRGGGGGVVIIMLGKFSKLSAWKYPYRSSPQRPAPPPCNDSSTLYLWEMNIHGWWIIIIIHVSMATRSCSLVSTCCVLHGADMAWMRSYSMYKHSNKISHTDVTPSHETVPPRQQRAPSCDDTLPVLQPLPVLLSKQSLQIFFPAHRFML